MSNLKPFNLEKALAGDSVVTRNGVKVEKLVYLPEGSKESCVWVFNHQCCLCATSASGAALFSPGFDLFMAPKTVTKYVNFYKDGGSSSFLTEIAAKQSADRILPLFELEAIAVPVTYDVLGEQHENL